MRTEEIHMGEIMDAVERVLAERGLRLPLGRDSIEFRFVTGRQREIGCDSYLGSGSYLTAVCRVETTGPRA